MSCEQLLKKARENLRCIEWKNMTKELMQGAICGVEDQSFAANELFKLSRPVRRHERIDYFMSHSWYDDPEAKWEALQQLVDEFQAQNGRLPTFWLDKVCMDQDNIGDGLR